MGINDFFLNDLCFMDSMYVNRREILIHCKAEADRQQHPQGNYNPLVDIRLIDTGLLFFWLFLVFFFSYLNHGFHPFYFEILPALAKCCCQ